MTTPDTTTIVVNAEQRDFLIAALNVLTVNDTDRDMRDELQGMLTDAESGDVINDFTL